MEESGEENRAVKRKEQKGRMMEGRRKKKEGQKREGGL